MKRKRSHDRLSTTLVALMLLALGAPGARADHEPVRPEYRRDGKQARATRRPPAGTLPRALRIEVPAEIGSRPAATADVSASHAGPAARTRRPGHAPDPLGPPRPAPPAHEVERLALQAAIWTAEEIARTVGWLEFYRVGVYEGIRTALADDSLGAWDHLQGLRIGRRDLQAHRIGSDAGARAAEASAGPAAESRVAEQFMDLSRVPRYAPRFRQPDYSPGAGWTVAPELADLFRGHPLATVPRLPRRLAEAFDGWRYDPWRLYRCAAYTEFYDAHWADPDRAFDLWYSDRRRSTAYRRLIRADRLRFQELFEDELAHRLRHHFERFNLRAFHLGFEDGWRYGAFVSYEWHFRLGYDEGFNQAATTAARAGFHATYGPAYERFYDRAFTDWSENPKPAILAVELEDGNHDGVFEPGEELAARFELVNYGGDGGRFGLRLDGQVLERPAETSVRLPARQRIRGGDSLRAVIHPDTPVRTGAELNFRLGDLWQAVPLRVSRPLEFAGGAALDRVDSLAGRAAVVARVVNRSRKPVRGAIDLASAREPGIRESRELGVLSAGEERSARIELSGLRPLELLSGGIEIRLSARSGAVLQDELEFSFPDLSADLGNRDLVRYMVALSLDPQAPASDIAAARSLILRRLRVDWRAAVRGSGNPYRYDYSHHGTRTALGDLVQAYQREKRSMVRPEVFAGLDGEIATLARELPGMHPFLRRHMKKLARRLS